MTQYHFSLGIARQHSFMPVKLGVMWPLIVTFLFFHRRLGCPGAAIWLLTGIVD